MKKKIFSIAIALVLLFSFVGCGKGNPTGIEGKWENKVDISEYLVYQMGDSVFAGYIQLDSVDMYLHYSFLNDGTFSVKVNEEKTKKSWDKFLDAIVDGMALAYETSNPGKSSKDFFEAYEKDTGSTVRETLAEKNQMSKLLEPFANSGYYQVKGNRLYRSDKPLEITDSTPYEIFSINQSILTILSSSDTSISAEEKAQYPFTFEWVSK